MIIPKYVQELMSRASFVLGSGEAGYIQLELTRVLHTLK